MTSSTHTALKIVVCAALALLVTSLTIQTIVHSAAALWRPPSAKSLLVQADGSLQSGIHSRAVQRSSTSSPGFSNGGVGPKASQKAIR